LKDCYHILLGREGHRGHVGLLDYPTLFLPRLLSRADKWCEDNLDDNILAMALLPPVFLLNFLSDLFMRTVALFITGLSSFIIGPVHLIAHYPAKSSLKEVLEMSLEDSGIGVNKSLATLLDDKDVTLDEIWLKPTFPDEKDADQRLKFTVWVKQKEGGIGYQPTTFFAVEKTKGIKAAVKLNVGEVLSDLEEINHDPLFDQNNVKLLLDLDNGFLH